MFTKLYIKVQWLFKYQLVTNLLGRLLPLWKIFSTNLKSSNIWSAMRKQVLALSDTAAARIRQLLQHQQKPFLRLAVEAKGCNGLSYVLNYARNFHFFPTYIFLFCWFFPHKLCWYIFDAHGRLYFSLWRQLRFSSYHLTTASYTQQ